MNFRPFPAPEFDRKPRVAMLKKGKISPGQLIESVVSVDPGTLDKISDAASKGLEKVIESVVRSKGGIDTDDGAYIFSQLLDKLSEALDASTTPELNLSIDEIFKQSVDKALKDLEEKGTLSPEDADKLRGLSEEITRRLRKRLDRIASEVIRSADISEMSDEDYKRLMDMVAELDLKQHGVGKGAGSGILSRLWVKLVTDPRTRAYIRKRLQELRTAAHYRQLSWPHGARISPRETFRKYVRTQIPFPPVYKVKFIRPKTREDIIFFADVSGSMSAAYPVIYALMRSIEDLGLNARMYVGDTEVAYVDDVEKVLSQHGGGGTMIGEGVNVILSELGSTVKDTTFIVYTDLEFGANDFRKFLSGLDKLRAAGSKVSVWVYDCDHVRDSVSVLEKEGFNVVCDVRSLRDMIDAAEQLKRFVLKRA